MNAFSHVYVMKTVNRNPHSNEMRLTDRYNVHICPCNNVGDILHKQSKCISAQLSCMPPFLKQINLNKFK